MKNNFTNKQQHVVAMFYRFSVHRNIFHFSYASKNYFVGLYKLKIDAVSQHSIQQWGNKDYKIKRLYFLPL